MAAFPNLSFFAGCCLLPVGFLVLTSACQPNSKRPAGNSAAPPAGQRRSLEAALTDSVRRYWHLQAFTQRNDSPDYVLHGTETAFGKVGVAAITDSVLLLFQEVGHRCQLTHRVPFDSYATGFKEIDLNGDDQNDFIVYGHPNMHGQAPPFVFLNDGKGRLRYTNMPGLASFGLDYDPVKKLVHNEYVGGVYDVHRKALYQWQGDSLRQVAGAELRMEHPDAITVRVFRMKNGKEYDVKTYGEEVDYDTVLFKSTE